MDSARGLKSRKSSEKGGRKKLVRHSTLHVDEESVKEIKPMSQSSSRNVLEWNDPVYYYENHATASQQEHVRPNGDLLTPMTDRSLNSAGLEQRQEEAGKPLTQGQTLQNRYNRAGVRTSGQVKVETGTFGLKYNSKDNG